MTRAEAIEYLTPIAVSAVMPRYKEALGTAITALQVSLENGKQASEWISISERLPEPFVSVLGYCPDEEPLPTVHECYVNGFGLWTSSLVYGMGNVTHWMPIPEPPEEGTP